MAIGTKQSHTTPNIVRGFLFCLHLLSLYELRMRELRISLLAVLWSTAYCLLPIASFSQRNNFQTYSLEQGLPQATIYCIIQDNRGYLWLGTDGGGLCRFDGINFKTYGKKEGFAGQNIRSL